MAEKASGSSAAAPVSRGDDAPGDELSPAEDKRLLRKIDLCLLPVMALSYLFQFLDKSAIGFTAIMGLREDLRLSGADFSWANAIYYFGYLAASYPAAVVLVRWRVGKTIAASVLVWGLILMLTAATANAAGLLAVRFFLGVAEAAIAPGLTVVVAMWYKRAEQPLRHAAWFLGNTTAGLVGSLAAYAIGHVHALAPWKAVFLIFGGATVAWAVALVWLLPDVPMAAWFLSKRDRAKAVARVRANMTGIKSNDFKWHQCREALLDAKTWFVVVIQLCGNIPNGGVLSFGSIVIKGMGFGQFTTLLLQSASYLGQLVLVLVSTGGSTRFRNTRTYFMACNFAIAVAGASLVRQQPAEARWTRFAGYCLSLAYSANFPLLMSIMSGNFGGFTKKVTVNAISFVAYCAGNIIGPQLFTAREAPSYTSGFLAMMVCFGVGIVSCLTLRVYLRRENRRRHREGGGDDEAAGVAAGDDAAGVEGGVMVNLMDKTDKQIAQFRYVY